MSSKSICSDLCEQKFVQFSLFFLEQCECQRRKTAYLHPHPRQVNWVSFYTLVEFSSIPHSDSQRNFKRPADDPNKVVPADIKLTQTNPAACFRNQLNSSVAQWACSGIQRRKFDPFPPTARTGGARRASQINDFYLSPLSLFSCFTLLLMPARCSYLMTHGRFCERQ